LIGGPRISPRYTMSPYHVAVQAAPVPPDGGSEIAG